MGACQATGYRLIMHCQTAPSSNRHDVITESYEDRPCQEAVTDLTPLRDGELAVHGSGPTSMYVLAAVFGILAYVFMQILMQRRNRILNQVYSKLSIVKTKN